LALVFGDVVLFSVEGQCLRMADERPKNGIINESDFPRKETV